MTEEIDEFDIINKEEIEAEISEAEISKREMLNMIKSINNKKGVRKKIKENINNKDYEIGSVDDEIILALSYFYIERNNNEDLKTAKECLNKVLNKENPKYLLCEAKILELEGRKEEAIKKYQNCIINSYPLKKAKEISECFVEISNLTNNKEILKGLELFFEIINPNVSNNNIKLDNIKSVFEIYYKFAEKVINDILEEENNQNKEQKLNNVFKNIENTMNIMKEILPENIKIDIEKYFKTSYIAINILYKDNLDKEQELNNFFTNIGNTPENIKLFVENFFKFAEMEIENILEKNDLNKEQKLNNFFINITNTINAIKGDFSEINGKNRSELFKKDEFFTFYQNIENKLSLKFFEYLNDIKNNTIVIDMLKTFSNKGSYVGFFKFDSWYSLGNEEYKNIRKNDMKKIAELEYKINNKDQTVLQRVGQFIFDEENIDINKIKKFFVDYKDCLEDKKQSYKENFRTAALELTRFFDDRLVYNKNLSIENIKNFKEEIKNLCDLYPYGFNYGNTDTTDYYNIILDKKNFFSIFENFKIKNLSESENNIRSKSFTNFCECLTLNDETSNKLEFLFNEIINNKEKFEYYIFYLYKAEFEKLEDLCPKFKGKTEEILKEKLLIKFEKNIDYINDFSNKNEINEDTKKEINGILNSLIKVTDIILNKELKISEENVEKLENLFNSLENNNIFPLSTIEVYKDTLKKLENLFQNLKGKTEEVLEEKRKLAEFECNLNSVNDLLAREVEENNKQTLDEENKKKIENLMNFVKNTTDKKIENLKIYKNGLKILFENLEKNKNKLVIDEIKKHEEELEKLKSLNTNILPENSSKQIE